MTKKQWIFTGIYFAVFFITAMYDLNISEFLTVHSPAWLKEFGDHFGCICGAIVMAFCFSYLGQRNHSRILKLLSFVPSLIAAYYIVHFTTALGIVLILVCGGLIGWFILFVSQKADLASPKAKQAAMMGIAFVIIGIIVNNVLKSLWGRPRFYSLENKETDFMPWYVLRPLVIADDSHKSFPSGHTTNAAFIIWFENLHYFYPRLKIKKTSIWIFSIIWVSLTALSRIAAGMHYLSDTVAAFGITLLIYVLMKNKFHLQQNEKVKES